MLISRFFCDGPYEFSERACCITTQALSDCKQTFCRARKPCGGGRDRERRRRCFPPAASPLRRVSMSAAPCTIASHVFDPTTTASQGMSNIRTRGPFARSPSWRNCRNSLLRKCRWLCSISVKCPKTRSSMVHQPHHMLLTFLEIHCSTSPPFHQPHSHL